MNRKAFFTSLFAMLGIADAQQWKQPIIKDGFCVATNKGDCRYMVALNNQCPVCGTMAGPYKKYKSGLIRNCKPAGEYLVSCEDDWITPDPQIVRCKRCNAAFWQEAR